MPRLMPQAAERGHGCGFVFVTAYTGPMACPGCGAKLEDVTEAWPHVCSRGHGQRGGGDCKACDDEERARKERHA